MARTPSKRPEAAARWASAARAAIGEKVEGGTVPLLAGPEAAPDEAAYVERLGFPGEFPYTRGIQPTMYRGRFWTFRQYSGFGSAAETNRRFRYLLAGGQTGLSVAFDLPTQIGLDADHARARGEVGRCGVSIGSLADMRTLFRRIPLDRATVSMTINATAPILTALLVATGEASGVARDRLGGTVQNDILKEYIARGTYIYPPAPSMRLATDLIEFAVREMPLWNFISVSGYHMREAGATAAQELAFTFANAIAYAGAARDRGLAPDAFLPRLSFFFSADRNFLEEIAKFRAARRIWAHLAKDSLGASKSRALQLRFHTQTAGSSLTAQQPELNVVRTTYEALAAVLGGTQSLHTNALDEALGLPTAASARLALRTQQILAEESGVPSTVDPLAGAYAIEELTDRLEAAALAYLDRVAGMGGALTAIEKGFPQAEIAREAYGAARALEEKRSITVGVNDLTVDGGRFALFPEDRRRGPAGQRVAPGAEARQRAAIGAWRRRHSSAKVRTALATLRTETEKGRNVMAPVIAAVGAGATLGAIADVWRELFGEHRPSRAY